jgi:hypothetical protein
VNSEVETEMDRQVEAELAVEVEVKMNRLLTIDHYVVSESMFSSMNIET